MTINNKTNNFRIKTGKDIKNLLRKGERINLECKKAKTSVPESLWESYSAFANTYGGTILLGIYEDLQEKDLSKRFIVTGVDDADKICVDLWNTLNNNEKVNINLLHDDDVKVIDIDGKNVVAVCVPRASYNERPIILT